MARPLWTLSALLSATGGTLRGTAPDAVIGISIDSRTVGAGDLFVAIRGDRFDGHDFVAQALANGAALALVGEDRLDRVGLDRGGDAAGPLLVVADDPLDALVRLAAAARARFQGRAIAVTGSVGKTSTKEMLKVGLANQGPVHAAVGSFNNHWGVPLTLARMPEATAFGIFEIGMNHSGEIRPLVRLVRPHVAIVTNVEPVHIEHFGAEEEIAEAKAEILEGLEPGGTAILNRDNRWFDLLRRRAEEEGAAVVSFGEHVAADMRLARFVGRAEGGQLQTVRRGAPAAFTLGAPGRHFAQNALAVVAAAEAAGADAERVRQSLARFQAPKGRGEATRLPFGDGGAITLIDESYNANPASMRAALAVLGEAKPSGTGRRIAVLGDMLELGPEGPALHAGLLDALKAAKVDRVFLVGPLMTALRDRLPAAWQGEYTARVEDMEARLADALRAGDVVMVKASAGTRLGRLVDSLKTRFRPAAA